MLKTGKEYSNLNLWLKIENKLIYFSLSNLQKVKQCHMIEVM